MKLRILLLLGVVAWHVETFNFVTGQLESPQSYSVTDSLVTFAYELLKVMAKENDGNLIYSPYGAWSVLAMAVFGAGGKTYTQLHSALALPDDDLGNARQIKSMIDNFANFTDYELRSAIDIFITSDTVFNYYFPLFAKYTFGLALQTVDFTNSDRASEIINKWASIKTSNRIKDFVKPCTLAKDTSLLLANAVHFKASWDHQFPSESTVEKPFYLRGDKIIGVTTMCTYHDYIHGELPNAEATFVKIPYKVQPGSVGLNMFAILPDKIDGLSTLVENFRKDFTKLFGSNKRRVIYLQLPKFTIESNIDFRDALIQMDSHDMFTKTANFTYIAHNSALRISNIFQKVVIDVNEAGSEAVAVNRHGSPPRVTTRRHDILFALDRPFLCVIATDTKIPLFIGIITNPNILPS